MVVHLRAFGTFYVHYKIFIKVWYVTVSNIGLCGQNISLTWSLLWQSHLPSGQDENKLIVYVRGGLKDTWRWTQISKWITPNMQLSLTVRWTRNRCCGSLTPRFPLKHWTKIQLNRRTHFMGSLSLSLAHNIVFSSQLLWIEVSANTVILDMGFKINKNPHYENFVDNRHCKLPSEYLTSQSLMFS